MIILHRQRWFTWLNFTSLVIFILYIWTQLHSGQLINKALTDWLFDCWRCCRHEIIKFWLRWLFTGLSLGHATKKLTYWDRPPIRGPRMTVLNHHKFWITWILTVTRCFEQIKNNDDANATEVWTGLRCWRSYYRNKWRRSTSPCWHNNNNSEVRRTHKEWQTTDR